MYQHLRQGSQRVVLANDDLQNLNEAELTLNLDNCNLDPSIPLGFGQGGKAQWNLLWVTHRSKLRIKFMGLVVPLDKVTKLKGIELVNAINYQISRILVQKRKIENDKKEESANENIDSYSNGDGEYYYIEAK